MHPIERLRYVARASGVPQTMLVRETAGALASFAHEPHGLVTACRQMLARQVGSGPMLWLASSVLTASDPRSELRRCIDLLEADTTAIELRHALSDGARVVVIGWPDVIGEAIRSRGDVEVLAIDSHGEGSGFVARLWEYDIDATSVPVAGLASAVQAADLVLLETTAIGPTDCLAVAGSGAAAAVAAHTGAEVWAVGGHGRLLPAPLWELLRARSIDSDHPWEADDEVVPLDLIGRIVGPDGVTTTAAALQRLDCPVAPELLA